MRAIVPVAALLCVALLAPALAELTLAYVQRGAIDNEVMQCC